MLTRWQRGVKELVVLRHSFYVTVGTWAVVDVNHGKTSGATNYSCGGEMSKYQADMTRLEQSITEAEQEQERSFAIIRQAIVGGTVATAGIDGSAQVAEGVWDQMRAQWEQSDGDLIQAVMRGAPEPPKAAAPRQLTAEAQAILAHFGVPPVPPSTAPAPSNLPAAPMPPIPPAPQLGADLQQLLQHFAASGLPPGLPARDTAATRGPMNTEAQYGGLDPSLFEPTSGTMPAFGGTERPPSSSVSPGARAKRALAAGSLQHQSVKAHTKPAPATAGQALAQKLEMVRAVASQKDAVEHASRTSPQTSGVNTDPTAMNASPGVVPTLSEPTAAMRPFGGHVAARPPQDLPPPTTHGEAGSRAIPIREVESEEDMDETHSIEH
ncbi:hypothetical protein AK812_SmicGene23979 [Symbiodinium microadriaticum]|uniref:Uncharacterized protein n=1 Tax=Symbiodinium microadriaticum TaxID=2951 RepID=A0A1Q9DFT1_SYMMI|nr:hypothetical protein AK812_SmicGene23979 [Symbiodinium microadriaticum]